MLNDIRVGLRMLLKRPGTSAIAVLALGLGIGLTTTMFSIVQGAFLRGLPFEESDRIVSIARINATRPTNSLPTTADDFMDWQAAQQSFEPLAAFSGDAVVVSGGLTPQRYRGAPDHAEPAAPAARCARARP